MRKLFILLTFFMATVVSCTSHFEEIDNITNSHYEHCQPLTKASYIDISNFYIDYTLLTKYLRISGKNIDSLTITPLVINNDTLAYHVQDGHQWEIISGDKRLPPVMIKSENSHFDVSDNDIQGLLQYIQNIRNSSNMNISGAWKFLESSELEKTSKSAKGGNWSSQVFTIGMWRAIDTVIIDETNQIPHIITTRWSQQFPWNGYTPYVNGKQSKVGCAAVAVGQILHHYRKYNHLNVEFPLYANPINNTTQFNETLMDASRWYSMAENYLDENTESSALMLAYLGLKIMGQVYNYDDTEITHQGIDTGFTWGELNFSKFTGYNYDIIQNNLDVGTPVCLFSPTTGDGNTHVYIIDRYSKSRTYYSITYEWDHEYKVTEEEYYSNDPSLFVELPQTDRLEMEFDILSNTYFGMNWGYANESYDSRFYLVKSYQASSYDDTGLISGHNTIHQPYWNMQVGTVTGVSYIYHSFTNAIN